MNLENNTIPNIGFVDLPLPNLGFLEMVKLSDAPKSPSLVLQYKHAQ